MTNYFVFNGQSSLELGIRIKSKNIFSMPKYDMSFVSIPGRNGDLINSNKRFGNVSVSYTCFVPSKSISELATKIRNIKKWLYVDVDSYHVLQDSYEPNFVKYAVFNNKLDITEQVNKIGVFTLTFSCKPFKILERALDLNELPISGATLFNPYPFASKPYLKIEGNGNITLTIENSKGTKVWNFANVEGYIEVDSELMSCFKETILQNNKMYGDEFPVLEVGENYITISGATALYISERWNTL